MCSFGWLAQCIRPDLAPAHSFLSAYCNKPLRGHWNAALYVLHYIHSTIDYGFTFTSAEREPLQITLTCTSHMHLMLKHTTMLFLLNTINITNHRTVMPAGDLKLVTLYNLVFRSLYSSLEAWVALFYSDQEVQFFGKVNARIVQLSAPVMQGLVPQTQVLEW